MPRSRKNNSKTGELVFENGSDNIFKDLGFPSAEAENFHIRGLLALEISKIIDENGWSHEQAATKLGISKSCVVAIMKSDIDGCSIDLLLKYLDKLGRRISFVVEKKNEVA